MNKFFIILLFLLNSNLYSQIDSENLDPKLFLNNITKKVFLIKGHDDAYYDLDRKSITKASSFGNPIEEEFFNLKYSVYKGSFVNPGKIEYLFMIKIPEGEFSSFFPHAENYGNTTLIFIFDENINQISEVSFQDYPTYLKDIVDINSDGINEVIMESTYGMQGCSASWLMLFVKNFDDPKLSIGIEHDCSNSGSKGEKINLSSTYTIFDKMIIFNSTLEYYICMGVDENNESDNRFLRNEYRKDVFGYEVDTFELIKDKDNVDWDDDRLMF